MTPVFLKLPSGRVLNLSLVAEVRVRPGDKGLEVCLLLARILLTDEADVKALLVALEDLAGAPPTETDLGGQDPFRDVLDAR